MPLLTGGCCGTTPAHIEKIVAACEGSRPRELSPYYNNMRLSGLETFSFTDNINFVNIGERCNIAGSRRFKRLIKSGEYDEALAVAQKQGVCQCVCMYACLFLLLCSLLVTTFALFDFLH